MKIKSLLLPVLGVLLMVAPAFGATSAKKRIVVYEQAPAQARNFIEKYFPQLKSPTVMLDGREYTMSFEEGLTVEFDRKGQWEEISAVQPIKELGFLPEKIVDHLNRHPQRKDFQILKISYDPKELEAYEIETSSRLELKFSKEGDLLSSEID